MNQEILPEDDEVIAFIASALTLVSRRELNIAFNINAANKKAFKRQLSRLDKENRITYSSGEGYQIAPPLPPVTVIEIYKRDIDGEFQARPQNWDNPDEEPPKIIVIGDRRSAAKLAVDRRVLARLKPIKSANGISHYEARIMHFLADSSKRVLGIYKRIKLKNGKTEGRLIPVDKRAKKDFFIPQGKEGNAEEGQLVAAKTINDKDGKYKSGDNKLRHKKKHQRGKFHRGKKSNHLPPAEIIEILGNQDDATAISRIAIATHDLPHEFSKDAINIAEKADLPPLGKREDLRKLPLVTIDGSDARDFDDAVFAEPDTNPKNPNGWHIIVAIADVSYYVKHDDPLDKEAYERGNSVYFVDRVVPMLPEALSNGLCSLRPNEDRAVLAAHLYINNNGELIKHRFTRALINSKARLTYEEVQAAADNNLTPNINKTLYDTVITPLYAAFSHLIKAREKRGTLELDLPERKILLSKDGKVASVTQPQRLDSHKLIEEFMILANIAAAETLSKADAPCIYRIHDQPDNSKLDTIRDILRSLDYNLAKGQIIQPSSLNNILTKAKDKPEQDLVNIMILRSQSRAIYSPNNNGHFGLALTHYAHFTSPIRRYADLIVHRCLISTLSLGNDGLTKAEKNNLPEIAEHISETEQRAARAERETIDRYAALYMADRVGAEFTARISGVTNFGLFVSIDENGAEGLIPITSLPSDFYIHKEEAHALIGQRTGRLYRLCASLQVRLKEAEALTGSLVFEVIGTEGADIPSIKNTSSNQKRKPKKSRKNPRRNRRKR